MMCPDCGCDITNRTAECPNCHHIFYATAKKAEPVITDYDIQMKQLELQQREIELKERELQMLNAIGQIEAINAKENAFANLLYVLDRRR